MFNDKEKIKRWLKRYNVKNYIINDDLTVDVNGNVVLSLIFLTEIPVQFNVVKGFFDIHGNKLTSLLGSPKVVTGAFYCYSNNLTSLQYSPEACYSFFCGQNKIRSLKYCPKYITGEFSCSHNNIKSLHNGPKKVFSFNCTHNKLTSLKGSPEITGTLTCSYNKLQNLDDLPAHLEYNSIISDFSKEYLLDFFKTNRPEDLF